ncbi:MAG: two-component sensor histidine kinase [Ruminococcus sp.]|nr:two-component sensor histidine kinase [Ruminococcus sp.]
MEQTEKKKGKKNGKKLSLKVTLTASFLLFSAVLIVTLWIVQTVFLDSFYKAIKTSQVRSCAHSVSDNIDEDSVDDLILDIEEQNAMCVSVYQTDEDCLTAVYRSDRIRIPDSLVTDEYALEIYRKAVDAGGEYSEITFTGIKRHFEPKQMAFPEGETVFDDRNNNTQNNNTQNNSDQNNIIQNNIEKKDEPSLERESVSRLAYAVINTAGESERLIIVESEITPVTSVVETLRFQLIIMTAVLVVISVIIALFTARSIAKPISDTNEKAKALAKQNYDVQFKGGRYKEIKELNDTLTYSASELKKVDTLRKELISNISHDLRTPLTMITGYSEVMRDIPGEMTPENIQIIIDEANRLNALVTDLLDISRLESGTADIKKAPFSLTRCIESIFSRYTKLIENEGYSITFDHGEEVFVEGDELRITQVVYNLINNAINYVGEDKTVKVIQTTSGDQVRIDVIDHGEGIPAEQIPYIWDRYYRVDKEHKTAKIGTGLGLSIVKNILKAHDAQFGVESEPGKGSDFYFILNRIQ